MGKGTGCAMVVFGGFLVLGSLAWFAGALSGQGTHLWAGGFGFLVVGTFVVAVGLMAFMARAVLREATLEAKGPVRLGEEAEFVLTLQPKKPLTLKPAGCTAKLMSREVAEYSAGTDSRTYSDTLHEAAIPFQMPALLDRDVRLTLRAQVPPTVPPTWKGKSNSFVTQLEVHIDIDGWPDLNLSAEVRVLPEVAGG